MSEKENIKSNEQETKQPRLSRKRSEKIQW